MQIHELNQFSGTPGSGDYLAIDNGTETMKVPGNSIFAAMTQSQAQSGSNTVPKVIAPNVFKAAVLAIARTISDAWVDISAAKVNLDTTASSGTDHDLYAAITALGWASDVIE
jgi:hypothetical protein